MKKRGFLDRFLFIINSISAFALVLSYLLPYIPPKTFPLLSVLSLGVPLLIIVNFLFMIFWGLRFKRHFFLSFIVLLIGYKYVAGWIQLPKNEKTTDHDLSIMSYNVRMFNAYNWIGNERIPQNITRFVEEWGPDVLATQEHYEGISKMASHFEYSYVKSKVEHSEFGSGIFSKYPIINKRSLDFPQKGNNNAIYVDIVKNNDTLRVFNVHFQSLNIKPGLQDIKDADSKQLIGRIGYGFKLQQLQAEMMMEEVNRSPYKTIIMGDFNNTAFSYIYKLVKGDRFKDAFLEAGSGFGQTFNINYFPLRIDFLMVEKEISVNSFEIRRIDYSDHFPVMAKIQW